MFEWIEKLSAMCDFTKYDISMWSICNLYRSLPSSVPKLELENCVFSNNSEVYEPIVNRLKFLLALFEKCLSDDSSTSIFVWFATEKPLIMHLADANFLKVPNASLARCWVARRDQDTGAAPIPRVVCIHVPPFPSFFFCFYYYCYCCCCCVNYFV